jgi:FSR family fosmidomycin resistance protein-like MFS transporter
MSTYTYKRQHMVAVYSVTHFLVDFACAFFMFRSVAGTPDGYLCVLLYNFCAFAMQMPLGIIADKWNRNFLFAVIGCVLVGLTYALISVPVTAVFVAGIGNAMFHIGGGIDVLNISEKKLGALGVFVSPGAFGIYYGTMLGKGNGFSGIIIPLALIAAAGLILAVYKSQKGTYPKNDVFSLEGIGSAHILIIAACLFLVVCLRSFVGLTLNFSWKSNGLWGTALICSVVFGKTIGGFIGDRLGIFKTSLFSLGIASLLFLLPQVPLAGVVAVFMFNMTMPITLWALAKLIPGAKGFAFGLLTFALFLGFLPVYLGINVSQYSSWIFALISAVSLVVLMGGLLRAKL